MRSFWSAAICFILIAGCLVPVVSAEKEVTLTGKLTCAKCDLKLASACATALVVKEKGKDVVYYVDDKSGKAGHEQFCKVAREGTVTGTVSEKDGKKTIAVTSVELKN